VNRAMTAVALVVGLGNLALLCWMIAHRSA
jgi:hypothetical protein